MSPCPLCWLRTHGFPQIPQEHTKEWWLWLEKHGDDKDVEASLDLMPSGIVED